MKNNDDLHLGRSSVPATACPGEVGGKTQLRRQEGDMRVTSIVGRVPHIKPDCLSLKDEAIRSNSFRHRPLHDNLPTKDEGSDRHYTWDMVRLKLRDTSPTSVKCSGIVLTKDENMEQNPAFDDGMLGANRSMHRGSPSIIIPFGRGRSSSHT